ncbi:hypothetical protein A2U01_0106650, partial [Trifolium medium]|nr:hypothetical protein [Trifolium medium]
MGRFTPRSSSYNDSFARSSESIRALEKCSPNFPRKAFEDTMRQAMTTIQTCIKIFL